MPKTLTYALILAGNDEVSRMRATSAERKADPKKYLPLDFMESNVFDGSDGKA